VKHTVAQFRPGDRIEQMYCDYQVEPVRHLWKVGRFVQYVDGLTAKVVIDDNATESLSFVEHLRPASAADQLAWALR
jgi:hypothetical protein